VGTARACQVMSASDWVLPAAPRMTSDSFNRDRSFENCAHTVSLDLCPIP
jgi:hypothetical protein